MTYIDDIRALAERLRMALDDNWPDIMDEGCAEIEMEHGVNIETARLDVEAVL